MDHADIELNMFVMQHLHSKEAQAKMQRKKENLYKAKNIPRKLQFAKTRYICF